MRELYAAELRAKSASNEVAQRLVDEWVQRHVDGSSSTVTRDDLSNSATAVQLDQIDQTTGMLWRSEIATGPNDEPAHVTVRIRIRAQAGSPIAPLDYEFRVPAIVRTLLRELDAYDGDVRCLADAGPEVGPSDVDELVSLLTSPDRRLPVVVVSRQSDTGNVLLDTRELTKELAGSAHVRVMSSSRTSWALTDAVGQPLSVFDGALRIYFPGMALEDDPYRHRLTFADRISERTPGHLRSWMGTLSAAAIGEHPAYDKRREDRRTRIRQAIETDDHGKLQELVALLDEDNDEMARDLEEKNTALGSAGVELSRAKAEVEQLKYQFQQMERARDARAGASTTSQESAPATVHEAVDRLEELAGTAWYSRRVALAPAAVRSARAFADYNSPAELLRAGQAVLEAGAMYHDNTLGEPPKDFFNRRGLGYGAQPTPHLKVDEATSPDQCLRIYWTENPVSRMWTITDVGGHR